MLKHDWRCDFAVLDDPALVMYATGADIGFLYAVLDASLSVFPPAIYARLPRAYADATVAVVQQLFNDDVSAVVTTALSTGETAPKVCVTPLKGSMGPASAALHYLSNFAESIVDHSLTEFTRRVLEAAANATSLTQRTRMEDGVVAIHMDVARRLGITDCLLSVIASKGCAIRWSNPPQHEVEMRLGPSEIELWMQDREVHLDNAGTLVSGELANAEISSSAMERVVLTASIPVGGGVHETLSFSLPSDLTAIPNVRLARRNLRKMTGTNVLPFPQRNSP